MKIKSKSLLFSRLCIDARLASSMRAVEKTLSFFPNLSQTRTGGKLCYYMSNGDPDCFYLLELGRDAIFMSICSVSSPTYYLNDALLKLLEIMHMLNSDYEIYANSLYPYLIFALSGMQIEKYSNILNKNEACRLDRDADLILAGRINSLVKEKEAYKGINSRAMERIECLTAKLLVFESRSDPSVSRISKSLGLEAEELRKMLLRMPRFGYKAIYKTSDAFELVKL